MNVDRTRYILRTNPGWSYQILHRRRDARRRIDLELELLTGPDGRTYLIGFGGAGKWYDPWGRRHRTRMAAVASVSARTETSTG
jgi:hypothetical protein